jgi:hypothetical protein
MRAPAAIAFVSILCISTSVTQGSSTTEPYNLAAAYEIYSLLLPNEESYGFAKDTLMIQQETVSGSAPAITGPCLTRAAANKFKDAIAGFNRVNRKKWILQPRFLIEKSYKLVGSDLIKSLPEYPSSSAAYVIMSPVGFNHEKTRAIVYIGSSCGGLCGSWRFHLLEKVNGNWKDAPGITCATYS